MAPHGRLAQADRRVPQRRRPASTRTVGRASDNTPRRTGSRRLARAAVPVLPRGAVSPIADRSHSAGVLRPAEIASAFLIPEATMAQRISRAKRTVAEAGARFELPDTGPDERRLAAVRQTLYLIFNEGYTASCGAQIQRLELAHEAI